MPNWPLQSLNFQEIYDLTKHLKFNLSHPTEDLVINYKPTFFSQRHDQTGVWTDLPMLHTGSTGQAVHFVVRLFTPASPRQLRTL